MALPKIEYPVFKFYIKSLDREVGFRPFLVKEEKILLIAKEGKDAKSIQDAIKQIIQNCAQEEIDVESLPLFDIEMIFLKLRAKSVGESVKLVFNCKNEVDGVICDTNTDYALNLDKVKYEVPEGHDPIVRITGSLGVRLKYPTINSIPSTDTIDQFELMEKSLLENIDYVFNEEAVYKLEDSTEQEQIEFIESLSRESLDAMEKFFVTSPKVVLEDEVTCKKCGFVHHLHSENLLDFFI
jgi:hypothetical protein